MDLLVTVRRTGPKLTDVAARQLPFATALAINRTLEEIQGAARAGIRERFTLRRPTFVERLVKINNADRARKDRLAGRVGIQGARADLLTKFEAGGTKRPAGRSIAVPIDAKRTKADIVRAGQRPRRVLEDPRSRAFMVRGPDGRGVIKQRVGRGRGAQVRVLFGLTPRAELPASLRFHETAERTARARFSTNLQGFLGYALRTAR
jgi:hypothetical protein